MAPRRRRATSTSTAAATAGAQADRAGPPESDSHGDAGGEARAAASDGAEALPALGPGSRRRPPPPKNTRPPGVPARRKNDVVPDVATPAGGAAPSRAATPTAVARAPSSRAATPTAADVAAADTALATAPPEVRAAAVEPDDGDAEQAPPAALERQEHTLPEPPPTRVGAEPYRPADIEPVPDSPEPGLFASAHYAIAFMRARWQRRGVIKRLEAEIRDDTASLDTVLGDLGREVRAFGIDNRVLRAENEAIEEAEGKRKRAERECAELENRQAEENARGAEIDTDKQAKVTEAETALERAQRELASHEAQRRSLRDKRKVIERQQKSSLKAAEDRDEQAAKAPMGESRSALRRAAEDLRRDAAGLDPERQDLERRLAALERPISQGMAKVETLRSELDACRQSLNDAREGHRHRQAELEAEQGRKSRELALADAEIQRRLVTLGTLVNLNRIERPEFAERYAQIDNLRGAIGARSTEIDRLSAEREAYDRGSLVRGVAVLGGGVVGIITLIAILLAVL